MNTFDSNMKKEKDFIIFKASSVLQRWAHGRGWQWSRLHIMNGPDWSTLPDVLAWGPDGSLCNLRPSSSEVGGGGVHTFQHVPLLPWDRSWKCYTDPDVWAGSKHVKAPIIKHPTVRDQPEQSYHYTAMIVWTRQRKKHTHKDKQLLWSSHIRK